MPTYKFNVRRDVLYREHCHIMIEAETEEEAQDKLFNGCFDESAVVDVYDMDSIETYNPDEIVDIEEE